MNCEIPHNKNIIILGYSGTANECPFDAEVWAINLAGKVFPDKKISYCFAFDKLPPEYVEEMKAIAPIISWQNYADIDYPLKQIVNAFHTQYFVNTACYMIAYAIFVETSRLSLYGCDTFLGATWQRESKGVEYWLSKAEDRGIELILPQKSGLLRPMQGRPYGKKGKEILLTLNERLILLNILPSSAPYNDMLCASTLRWILCPKADEQQRYNIYFGYDIAGKYNAVCGEEFRIDVPMAEDVWNYLRKCFLDYERDYGLTGSMLSIYETIMTTEWREGEYEKLD